MLMNLEDTYDKIYRYCFMKLHSSQAAEDITQETFLHYFRVAGAHEIENINAYLYGIARNLCADYYRMQSFDSIDEAEVAGRNECESSELRIALEQAMESLPCDEKEILFLRYTNDISINEIANILCVSRFAVYRKERHALKLLREKVDWRDFL